MPKDENPRTLTVVEMASLLGVTDRQVRNWIKDKGLPAQKMPGVQRLNGRAVIAWYVNFRVQENGNTGNGKPTTPGIEPLEDYDQALSRRTRAEADLKELQLARERGEVAAIADVEKVMSGANKSIETLILALPSSLTPQLIGMADRNKIYTVIDRAVRSTLGNLANIDAVRHPAAVSEDDPE